MRETLIIDGHVHIYPNFDLERAITSSLKNFVVSQRTTKNRTDAIKAWLLTERSDCHFFEAAPGLQLADFLIEQTAETAALVIKNRRTKEPLIYVLAGRQIISTENLEICALATTLQQPDKTLPAAELVAAINKTGGLAALNWAPGKWFGKRGQVVKNVFETLTPRDLFVSDTTMRPTVWSTPKLMAAAQRHGFRVVSGSDPLPFDGEERLIGQYAFLIEGDFDDSKPATSLVRILSDPNSTFTACGRRSGPFTFLRRQLKIMADKKK